MNIFKHWFTRQTKQNIDNRQNPWAGLASYEDPETAEHKLKFCGRDDESYDVAKLITGNIFVTLYGKSGIGKTSLLNAGVFPELREDQYAPLSLRLGMRDDDNLQSYQAIIIKALEQTVQRKETVNVIPEQMDQQAVDFLWNYFARHRFYDKYDEKVTPVIVFDQFEEVFRYDHNEVETLLRQLDYLNDKDHTLDNCMVEGQPYRYESNFRFVISIREDDLYRLEDSIDNCYLPALKRCRYRLRGLSEESAKQVILIPGEGLFHSDEQEWIAETIIQTARNKEDHSVSTNLLSLICNRIFVDYLHTNSAYISQSLVEGFIKDNPFERFYNEATRGFSNREKSYIEEHFVDSDGRRNSIPESDFMLHVPKGEKLLGGNTRILQRVNSRIELIHDSFCAPLADLKKKREARKKTIVIIMVASVILLCLGVIALIISQRDTISQREKELEAKNEQLEKEKNLAVANEARFLVRNGDAMSALENIKKLNFDLEKSYLPEIEEVARAAYDSIHFSTNISIGILHGHTSYVRDVAYSHDGKMIATCSNDETIVLWDALTGKKIRSWHAHNNLVSNISFSTDDRLIVSGSYVHDKNDKDGTVKIWETKSGHCLDIIPSIGRTVGPVCFSGDGNKVAAYYDDGTVIVYDLIHRTIIYNTNLAQTYSSSISLNKDGSELAYSVHPYDENGEIGIIEIAKNKKTILLQTVKKDQWIGDVAYSPNYEKLIGVCLNKILVWDKYYKLEKELVGNKSNDKKVFEYTTFRISNDGDKILVQEVCSTESKSYITNEDHIESQIHLWNLQTEKLEYKTQTGIGRISAFSPFVSNSNVRYLASTDDVISISIWNLFGDNKNENVIMSKNIGQVAYSPRYNSIIWRNNEGIIKKENGKYKRMTKIGMDRYFLLHNGDHILYDSIGNMTLYDINNKKKMQLTGHHCNILGVELAKNEKRMVSIDAKGNAFLWDFTTGEKLQEYMFRLNGDSQKLTLNKEGSMLAYTDENQIHIYNFENKMEFSLNINDKVGLYSITDLAFSPNGKHLATVSDNGVYDYQVGIWDIPKREKIDFIHDGHRFRSVAYSGDGRYLIVGTGLDGNKTYVYETKSYKNVYTFNIGEEWIDEVSFVDNDHKILLNTSAIFSHTVIVRDFLPIKSILK